LFYHNGQLAEARWGGSESGTVSYPNWATFPYRATGAGETAKKNIAENNFQLLKEGDVNGAFWVPAMADAPLRGYNGRHEWFWEPGDEAHIFPLENLMEMYYKSVGRNATLIMGLTPDPDGLLPEPDVKRLKEWGDEIKRRFSNPLATTSGKGNVLELKFKEPMDINHLIVQEDIAKGERIRKYQIEAYSEGRWQVLTSGSSIGNKRIEKFDTIKLSRLRIKIIDSDGLAQIKNMSAFFVDENGI
jgi:hypothetical protein